MTQELIDKFAKAAGWIKCEDEFPPCNGNYECLEAPDSVIQDAYYDGYQFYKEDNYYIRHNISAKWWRRLEAKQPRYGKQPIVYEWDGKIKPQLTSGNPDDWYVVSSKNGKCDEGFPLGEYLCPTLLDVSDCISNHKINDPMIRKYKQEPVTGTGHYEF